MTSKNNRQPVAYGYSRVSTNEQVIGGRGLSDQKLKIENYYKNNLSEKYRWGGIFEEKAKSGWKTAFADRGAGRALLAILQEGDIVLATEVDRLSRRPLDIWRVADTLSLRKVGLVIVDWLGQVIDTSTVLGAMFISFASTMAMMESEVKSNRQKASWERRRKEAKGRKMYKQWGYKAVRGTKFYVPDPVMLPWARKAFILSKTGMKNRDVRAALESEYCKQQGRPFKDSEFHDWFFPVNCVPRLMEMWQWWLDHEDV